MSPRKKVVVFDAEGFPIEDPEGIVAPFPGESRRDACRRWAAEDEIEEDELVAEREATQIRALREEELFAAELSTKSLTSLPQAIRRLYRQNPSNPRFKAMYDDLVRELYDRTDDTLRASLPSAVDRMLDIMEHGQDKDALRAAIYVFERLRGKTPDIVQHRQEAPFQVVMERLVAGPRMAAAARTTLPGPDEPVDAEIVSESLSEPDANLARFAQGVARGLQRSRKIAD